MKVLSTVDIVTCGECKHNKSNKFVDCIITEMYGRTLDNFCSLGDRKNSVIHCKDCLYNYESECHWLYPYAVKYTSDNNTCKHAVRRREDGTV